MLFTLLIVLPTLFTSCSSDDEKDNGTIFQIYCTAKVKYENVEKPKGATCSFYFFEPGEYISFEKKDFGINVNTYGLGVATKPDGTKVESLGYATYIASDNKYAVAKYRNWSDKYKQPEILEGTYYVVCVYNEFLGRRFPYKAKIFTKDKNKALVIEPIFSDEIFDLNHYIDNDGYKYFEWDE